MSTREEVAKIIDGMRDVGSTDWDAECHARADHIIAPLEAKLAAAQARIAEMDARLEQKLPHSIKL